jgi:hypothetical protein
VPAFAALCIATVDRLRALIADRKLTVLILSISGQFSFVQAQRAFVEAFAENIVNDVAVENSRHSG